MDRTDYHEFQDFEPGEGWDHSEDFAKLDARLELRGALSERPNASAVPSGAKFVVDQGEREGAVFIEDNGSWEHQNVDAHLATHSTVFDENQTIPAGRGAVLAGPIEGTGSISGDGRLVVVGAADDTGGS